MANIFGDRRLPTGIDALDRQLDGGFPPGSVVAYCAPPASQSELLLYELSATRPTLYLSTSRTEQAVRDAFDRAKFPTGDPEIRFLASDAPLQNATRQIMTLTDGANLIIDPADTLERAETAGYPHFLNDLQNHMQNTGGLAVLHCLRGDDPSMRITTEHVVDVILDLTVDRNGSELETRLAVPKFRGGTALKDTIKLELTDRIQVDTSRDIA